MHSIVDSLSLSSRWVTVVSLVVEGFASLLQLWRVALHRHLEAARQVLQATYRGNV